MGYVPDRRYEKVKGTLDQNGLAISLPSSLEDTWFFMHLWLKESQEVTAKRSPNPEEEGCTLFFDKKAIRSTEACHLENLFVWITAQGTVFVCFVGNLKTANLLRSAAKGYETSSDPNGFISFH